MNPPLLTVSTLLYLCASGSFAPGQEAAQPRPQLHWSGERAESLEPTGRRVFAGRLEPGLGFRGAVGYGDLAHGLRDPLRLEVSLAGQPMVLERVRVDGYDSHQAVLWRGAGLELLERKYITEDDELIDELEFTSTSQSPIDLELHLRGAATPELDRTRSKMLQLSLAEAANLSPTLERELAVVDPASAGMTYDGVGFQFARAAGEERPAFLALRGGDTGGATWELPLELSLNVPDVAPAIGTLHLLCAAPAPQGRAAAAVPAHFRFQFDDGTSESVPWPSIADRLAGQAAPSVVDPRHTWYVLFLPVTGQPALRLEYVPPPGRFVRRLELRKGEGPEVPVWLAATLELPPANGRPALHVGRAEFLGEPVCLALAGEEFVPVLDERGQRVLLRSLHLEPGASLRVRSVLSTGPRATMTALRALDRVGDDETFARHLATRANWFEEFVPEFTCSDERLAAAWDRRWQLVRRSLLRLDVPDFSLPVFYRGLGQGLDYVSPQSTGRVLDDLRWMRDLRFAQGQLRALCKAQKPGQRLDALRPGERLGPEFHSLPQAALGVFEVSASRQFLAEVWPSLVADFDATWNSSGLPASTAQTASQYASARALARGLTWLGSEEEAARMTARAASLQAAAGDGIGGALDLDLGASDPGLALRAADLVANSDGDARLDSAWADLVVRRVAGLVPAAGDELELWPRVTDLEHFRLRRLVYHGHDLEVLWDRPDGVVVHPGEPEGFSAKVDGRRVFLRERLERVHGIPLEQE